MGGQGTCFEESWPKVMLVTALTSVTVPARGLRLLILLTGAPFSGCPSSHRLGPVSRWTHCSLHPAYSHRAPFPSPFAPDMIATPLSRLHLHAPTPPDLPERYRVPSPQLVSGHWARNPPPHPLGALLGTVPGPKHPSPQPPPSRPKKEAPESRSRSLGTCWFLLFRQACLTIDQHHGQCSRPC